jgi:hypothetical protein
MSDTTTYPTDISAVTTQDIDESVLLAKLDDFEAPSCESIHHSLETDHHSGAAAFLFFVPCGHGDGYRCAAFAKWIVSVSLSQCRHCGQLSPPSDLILIPIGGQN